MPSDTALFSTHVITHSRSIVIVRACVALCRFCVLPLEYDVRLHNGGTSHPLLLDCTFCMLPIMNVGWK